MENIQLKKQRDWLTIWTILVLPGLFWSSTLTLNFFTERKIIFGEAGENTNDFFLIYFFFSLASPVFCFVLALLNFLFVKKRNVRPWVARRSQVIFNVILSVLFFGTIVAILLDLFDK